MLGGINAYCGSKILKALDNLFPCVSSEGFELENIVVIKFYLKMNTDIGVIKKLLYTIGLPKELFEPVENN